VLSVSYSIDNGQVTGSIQANAFFMGTPLIDESLVIEEEAVASAYELLFGRELPKTPSPVVVTPAPAPSATGSTTTVPTGETGSLG
jgi:hypothetical protein